ncbi:FxsA family protein [bacterium]|nr:FxsA family protein [bacterium]
MNPFFLIFIALPALEVFFMIKVGSELGALNTIFLIFLTAVIGVYLAKLQGLQTLKSGMINLYHNKSPIYELLSGASIAIAAFLLIVPGFFTDFIGFLLLIPFTRKVIFSVAIKNKVKKNSNNEKDVIDGEIVDKKDEL